MYQAQIALPSQSESAAARSGPSCFQLQGSSTPRHCLTLRFVHSIDQCAA
jgi:hypothetical protein